MTLTARPDDEIVLLIDDEPRPDGTDRYAIYEVVVMQNDVAQVRIAETSRAHVIGTIETLYTEDQIARGARIGVFDREKRTWTINPFV